MMTKERAYDIIDAFETTTLPPMCEAWDKMRVAAIAAMKWLDEMQAEKA